MADKKKMKQRKVEEEKPTKEEYAVAKYLRFNLPPREGKLHGMEVQCFFGNAAVDKLMESKWSAAKNAKEPLFTNRVSCVSYMLQLLEKGLFHRAEREKRKKDKDDKEKPRRRKKEKEEKDESTAAEEEVRERKGKKDKKGKKEIVAVEETTEQKGAVEKVTEKKDEKKKKEKRLRLVMPDQQFFEDGDEVYVWIYDPVNAKNFIIGLFMVLGAIALCMFPLWPPEVRNGVYYLSLSAAGFVGFILSLVVVRLILFCIVIVLTIGRHHFWLLPNLTEDVGFFDSFKPLYKHEYVPPGDSKKAIQDSDKKKKKAKKAEKGKKEKASDKEDSDEFEVIKKEELSENATDEDKDMDEGEDIDDKEVNEGDEDEEDIDNNDDDENIETDEENEENDSSESTERKKTK